MSVSTFQFTKSTAFLVMVCRVLRAVLKVVQADHLCPVYTPC